MGIICKRFWVMVMAHAYCDAPGFSGQAPGSLILMGEHAVLYQKHAMVMAIDHSLQVNLIPREDSKIRIVSALGTLETTVETLELSKPFEYILTCIHYCHEKIKRVDHGFEVHIQSDFSHTVGFGSSAAVVVAFVVHSQNSVNCPKIRISFLIMPKKL